MDTKPRVSLIKPGENVIGSLNLCWRALPLVLAVILVLVISFVRTHLEVIQGGVFILGISRYQLGTLLIVYIDCK